jgi:hypothetical protein
MLRMVTQPEPETLRSRRDEQKLETLKQCTFPTVI